MKQNEREIVKLRKPNRDQNNIIIEIISKNCEERRTTKNKLLTQNKA